ncbi:MAG TPA: hypothetical protein VD947_00575 [Patescibacteria group bacterium]|nr:hypothetical protein [Patescibacteria group bacterium]
MNDEDIKGATIRHINLSGDMYVRLVFGEENPQEKYLFQKHAYSEKRLFIKWLEKIGKMEVNYIKPNFRKLDKKQSYIYIVSLWGDVNIRKSILRRLYKMKKKHNKILIVGYWGDPGFDLDAYNGYNFDLLVTSQEPHMRRWKNLKYLHFPVASLGLLGKKHTEKYDCFSIGTHTELRLNKIINCEEQFHNQKVNSYYCVAGMQPSKQQQNRIDEIKKYRKFPDRDFMAPEDTLRLCASTRVLLNISRLPKAYEASPSFYAIMFNKKLLIDSDEIKKNPYYDPRYMKVVDFTKNDWLTPALAEWIKKPEKINYNYKGEWEPDVFYNNVRALLKVN